MKYKFNPNRKIGGRTNAQRADVAESALRESLKARGDVLVIDEDAVRDLFADLLHFCDREGIEDPEGLFSTAFIDWESER